MLALCENGAQHKHNSSSYVRPMKTLVPDSAHSAGFGCVPRQSMELVNPLPLRLVLMLVFMIVFTRHACAYACAYACITSENQA